MAQVEVFAGFTVCQTCGNPPICCRVRMARRNRRPPARWVCFLCGRISKLEDFDRPCTCRPLINLFVGRLHRREL